MRENAKLIVLAALSATVFACDKSDVDLGNNNGSEDESEPHGDSDSSDPAGTDADPLGPTSTQGDTDSQSDGGDTVGAQEDLCAGPNVTIVQGDGELYPTETTAGLQNLLAAPFNGCPDLGSSAGPEHIYEITVDENEEGTFVVQPVGDWDVQIYIVSECGAPITCLDSADDGGPGASESLRFSAPQDGTWYVVIDGAGSDDVGEYSVHIAWA
ncbi:MAG: hypothetical protein JKY37_34830 [Nannocystaceae bacterium]|nr:hypothetical protein [Nannocystaceae bacterium]